MAVSGKVTGWPAAMDQKVCEPDFQASGRWLGRHPWGGGRDSYTSSSSCDVLRRSLTPKLLCPGDP